MPFVDGADELVDLRDRRLPSGPLEEPEHAALDLVDRAKRDPLGSAAQDLLRLDCELVALVQQVVELLRAARHQPVAEPVQTNLLLAGDPVSRRLALLGHGDGRRPADAPVRIEDRALFGLERLQRLLVRLRELGDARRDRPVVERALPRVVRANDVGEEGAADELRRRRRAVSMVTDRRDDDLLGQDRRKRRWSGSRRVSVDFGHDDAPTSCESVDAVSPASLRTCGDTCSRNPRGRIGRGTASPRRVRSGSACPAR